uniref:Uncharacterized protein n=1 Tax=Oryza brachyantha TaxID=4533 RepID=J3N149_ORYBR
MPNSSRQMAGWASPPRWHHLMIVTDPMQSHINSARRLTVRVTFSTGMHLQPLRHVPAPQVLQGVVSSPAAVTRVLYTVLVGWGSPTSRGVPAALHWAKPATVFAVYHHYFHGHAAELLASCKSDPSLVDVAVLLQALPPLKRNALPSFTSMVSPGKRHYLTLGMLNCCVTSFSALGEHDLMVPVDTLVHALEPAALCTVPCLCGRAVQARCVNLLLPGDTKVYRKW